MDGGGGKQAVSSAKYQGSKWELSRVAMVSQELASKWLLLKMAAEEGKVRRRHSLSLPPAGAEVEQPDWHAGRRKGWVIHKHPLYRAKSAAFPAPPCEPWSLPGQARVLVVPHRT